MQSSLAVVWASRLVIFSILYALQGYVPIVPFLVSKGQVGIILSTQAWASVAALILGLASRWFIFFVASQFGSNFQMQSFSISRIPSGYGIDKYGAKGVLQLGVLMALTSLGLMGVSSNFPMQLLARVVLGAATSVACTKLLSE